MLLTYNDDIIIKQWSLLVWLLQSSILNLLLQFQIELHDYYVWLLHWEKK